MDIAAIWKILALSHDFLSFWKKGNNIEYIMFLIMKQKTRFDNSGNIGYRPMNISVSAFKKAISVDLY